MEKEEVLIKSFSILEIIWACIAVCNFLVGITDGGGISSLIGSLILLLLGSVAFDWRIIVTSKSVIVKRALIIREVFPMDSISYTGTSALGAVIIATSSGKTTGHMVYKYSSVEKIIKQQINERHTNAKSTDEINMGEKDTSSVKNDLIQLKELLDEKLISQEEFDIKRSELLKKI